MKTHLQFKTFLAVTGWIFLFPSSIYAQTIIIDPVTYEIKIVDETTGKEITEKTLEEESKNTSTTSNPTTWTTNPTTTWNTNTQPSIEQETGVDQTKTIERVAPLTTTQPTKTELEQAIAWMYSIGMTKFNTVTSFQWDNFLTREQLAKIIDRFYTVMAYPLEQKNSACSFNDLKQADTTLQGHIVQTCKLGIFKGYADGSFRPFKNITHAEMLAVMMRIYNQKTLSENGSPRRQAYYDQARTLGITQITKADGVEANINRKETALYLRRLKSVIESKWKVINNPTTTTPPANESSILKNIGILWSDINPQNDPQLKEALHTLYENGMIGYDDIDNAFLYANATRADVAKILDMFGDIYIQWYTQEKNAMSVACKFQDIASTHRMYIYINNVCKKWLMVGDDENNFLPFNYMSKAQFTAALVRLIEWPQNENYDPRRQKYKEKAQQRGIIGDENTGSFEREITNMEVILYLHKLIINNIIANNLDLIPKVNEFLNVKTYNNQTNVYIDINFLRTLDNKLWSITREDQEYKVSKLHVQEYPNFHIARYGRVHDKVNDETVGTMMILADKKHILYGVIRRYKDKLVYKISPDTAKDYEYVITKSTRP